MTNAQEWVLAIETAGGTLQFEAAALPVTIGADASADVRIAALPGTLQIGLLDEVFFVQAGRGARNLRVDGSIVTGTHKLKDGAQIAFDTARFACSVAAGRLRLVATSIVIAPDTAPPDLEEVARKTSSLADDVAITPISFKANRPAQIEKKAGPSKAAIAIGAAFAVLAAFAWFALSARSVQLQFEPPVEQMSVPGTLLKLKVGDRFMLRPGSHRVAAELAGYYPFTADFTVGREQGQSITFQLERLPGLVTLMTSPSTEAQVTLDGEQLGTTPLTDVEIKPGLHRLEFAAARYLTEVRELTVEGGGARQELSVPLTPNWAPVRLVTEPAGAEVLVDGTLAGTTPIALELDAGERALEARLSGYNAWRDSVVVNANEPQELPVVKLNQADGRIELVSIPSEASVSVDGQFLGRTPLSVRLSPGRAHQITLAKPGYAQATQQLSVAADSGRRVQVELVAQLGDVEVQSDPASAEVWVDGRREGVTPTRLTLSAIEHTIEVKQAGYATASSRITPRPGFPQQLAHTLVPLDDTSGSGYPQTLKTKLGQELKLVPAGRFLMGSSRRETDRRSNEVLRPVKISRAFYLGVREVTNGELRLFLREHDSGYYSGQSLNGDDQPAVNVSWNDAARYMNWLSSQEALDPVYEESAGTWIPARPLRNGYRLPTEAEWEWAARAAGQETPLRYPWGADLPLPDRSGNYADLTAREILPTVLVTYTDGFPVSAPSGTFDANAVGLFDLGGNVAEWIQDYYSIALPTAAEGELIEDPLGDVSGDFHVVRGASWRSATVTDLRLAYRNYSQDARDDVGFRIARGLR